MDDRERIIRQWFDMWLKKDNSYIMDIFSKNAEYIESWGPAYKGVEKIKLWFDEWNTRGNVTEWNIKQYFHKGNQTIVEWFFKNTMENGKIESFDGLTLVKWTNDNKICFLKEFGCNLNHYDPYENDTAPHFQEEQAMWF